MILINTNRLKAFKQTRPIEHIYVDRSWSNNADNAQSFRDKIILCRRMILEKRPARVTVVFDDGRSNYHTSYTLDYAKQFLKYYDPSGK